MYKSLPTYAAYLPVLIHLFIFLQQHFRAFPTLLDKEDSLIVYESIYSTNRALALAAAEFVNIQLFSNPRTANHSESLHQESKQTLIDLISFFNDGSLHKSTAYLVDALLEINSSLKDWPVYIEMLLSNESCTFLGTYLNRTNIFSGLV